MAKSGNNRGPLRMVLDLCLKTFVAVLLISGVQNVGAIRTGELQTYHQSFLKNLAPPSDLITGAHTPDDQGDDGDHSGVASKIGEECACNYHADLEYTQDPIYLPDGMPAFRVTFTNTCLGCSYSDIHVLCGDFSSPKQDNTIAFEYESTYAYPMTIGRARCSCQRSL